MSHERNRDEDTPTDVPMKLEEMSKLLKKIDRAICGDRFNPEKEPGMLAIVTELTRDYYGDDDTGRMGTKKMVLKMWDMRVKIAGGVVVLTAVVSGLAWIIELWFSHK